MSQQPNTIVREIATRLAAAARCREEGSTGRAASHERAIAAAVDAVAAGTGLAEAKVDADQSSPNRIVIALRGGGTIAGRVGTAIVGASLAEERGFTLRVNGFPREEREAFAARLGIELLKPAPAPGPNAYPRPARVPMGTRWLGTAVYGDGGGEDGRCDIFYQPSSRRLRYRSRGFAGATSPLVTWTFATAAEAIAALRERFAAAEYDLRVDADAEREAASSAAADAASRVPAGMKPFCILRVNGRTRYELLFSPLDRCVFLRAEGTGDRGTRYFVGTDGVAEAMEKARSYWTGGEYEFIPVGEAPAAYPPGVTVIGSIRIDGDVRYDVIHVADDDSVRAGSRDVVGIATFANHGRQIGGVAGAIRYAEGYWCGDQWDLRVTNEARAAAVAESVSHAPAADPGRVRLGTLTSHLAGTGYDLFFVPSERVVLVRQQGELIGGARHGYDIQSVSEAIAFANRNWRGPTFTVRIEANAVSGANPAAMAGAAAAHAAADAEAGEGTFIGTASYEVDGGRHRCPVRVSRDGVVTVEGIAADAPESLRAIAGDGYSFSAPSAAVCVLAYGAGRDDRGRYGFVPADDYGAAFEFARLCRRLVVAGEIVATRRIERGDGHEVVAGVGATASCLWSDGRILSAWFDGAGSTVQWGVFDSVPGTGRAAPEAERLAKFAEELDALRADVMPAAEAVSH